MSATRAMRPRIAASEAPPPSPLIDTSTVSPPVAAMADIVNDVAAPFQSPPDPAKGTLGAIEHGIGAVMGVVGAPFELMDTGFALATSSVAALMPGFPAATLTGPHLGMLHGHLHPPSLIPPAVVPIPLPSIGNILCSGAPAVLVGGLPAARAGDVGLAVLCFSTSPAFEVYTGSSNTFIGGSRAARMLDITRHCNPVSALGKLGAAFGAVGVAAGAIGAGASANAGDATQASILAKQAAADAAALAMSALLGKDPGIPPSMGAVMAGNPTVLVGGFPMPDLMDLLGGLLKGLKKLGALAGMSPSVRKAFAKIGLCNSPGEPVDSFTGVVYNDFEDYRDPRGFVWERHYRSSWNEESGPLGYGYRHFYQRRLTLLRKEVVYEAHDGEQALIPRASGGGFVVGGGFRLEEGGPGNYVLYTDRDEVLDFVELPTLSRSARLSRYRAQGVELSLTYDDVGRLTRLTEVGHGEPIDTTLRYDIEGRIVELRRGNRHGEARTISTYTYDEGCLVTWQDALGGTARMLYDARHRMIRGTDRRATASTGSTMSARDVACAATVTTACGASRHPTRAPSPCSANRTAASGSSSTSPTASSPIASTPRAGSSSMFATTEAASSSKCCPAGAASPGSMTTMGSTTGAPIAGATSSRQRTKIQSPTIPSSTTGHSGLESGCGAGPSRTSARDRGC